MSTPTYFTVVGDFKSIITDSLIDADIDPDYGVLTASVTFTPMIERGSIVRATSLSPRPTGLIPTPIAGFIDTDGRLKLRQDPPPLPARSKTKTRTVYDYTPIRLLADTQVLELDGSLFYSVVFSDVTIDGAPFAFIKGFTFQAPPVDVELNLVSLIAGTPGSVVTPGVGGIGIAPGALRMNGTTLIMSVGGVDLPDPIDFSSYTIQHGTATGQFSSWDATLQRWVPGKYSVGTSDNQTLVWSVKESQWVVGDNTLNDLTDVNSASRKSGGPLKDFDKLQYDAASKTWNVVPESDFLTGLGLNNPKAGDIIIFDGVHWNNVSGYSRDELDQRLANVVSGLARKPAVQSVQNDPPATPVVGENFIVGKTPTGDWVGHQNKVVFWDGTQWIFEPPLKGDTHTDLSTNQSLTWNETDWVSLGKQASALKDLQGVALGVPTAGQVLTYDGTNWVSSQIPAAAAIPMDGLSDVESVSASDGDILVFDGSTSLWKPGRNSAATELDNLKDVVVPAPTAGDILAYDAKGKAWVGVQPTLANPNLGALADVDVSTPPEEFNLLEFDGTNWVPTDTVDVSAVYADTLSLAGGNDIIGFASQKADESLGDDVTLASITVTRELAKQTFLEELEDCHDLSTAGVGQVASWDGTKWVPVDQPVPSPIIFLGTGAWDSKLVASKADNYGMAADTVPDPKVWTPKPGDQYIDLATGVVTAFT